MSFEDAWASFLWGIENTIKYGEVYGGLDPEGVRELTSDVMQVLRSEDARRTIGNAARELDQSTRELLRREVELWNDAVDTTEGESEGISNRNVDHTGNPEQRLTQAKTIKDSVEELLGLPSWLQKPLKILNEILELIA